MANHKMDKKGIFNNANKNYYYVHLTLVITFRISLKWSRFDPNT